MFPSIFSQRTAFSSMLYIHRFHDLHRSMHLVFYLHTTIRRHDDVMTRAWHNVMTLCRPTTERGHCSHAFAVHEVTSGDVRHACVQRCRGNWTERSGTDRRPSLCVNIVHMWNLLEVTFCLGRCLVSATRRGAWGKSLRFCKCACLCAKVCMLVVRSRYLTS
jgi:hypothetical protein